MLIIPAIDLKKSKVVRLHKGNFENVTSYGLKPENLAKDFIIKGVRRIHIVSLLGAKEGKILEEDLAVIKEIVKIRDFIDSQKCALQLGGGIRKQSEIKQFIELGIDYVIVGTAIVLPQVLEANFTIRDIAGVYARADKKFQVDREIPEPDLIDKLKPEIKERIIVGIDVSRDSVALSGWLVAVPIEPSWVITRLIEKGYLRFIITDTTKDGTLAGIDIEVFSRIINSVKQLPDRKIEFLIAGGIGSEKDIEIIANSGLPVSGVITGKALYEGKIQLHTLIKKYQ
ncbi:MAG: HisA/HisF-related TIM barrel protein [Candidatus Omnitrophica bacterium]|nr:HisA/HisF-related TIM barrel protein [Candidatus Omnitrophota bacterium]MCM8829192.1 HisA/HisF-related TIM barrel protein [Candidatus Omnitrophota bacterium]